MSAQSADRRLLLQGALRTRTAHRGQVLILAVIIILLFIFTATALIDVYHLEEARNWGYQVAQDAAMAGASYSTTRWEFIQPTIDPLMDTPTPRADDCMNSVPIELNGAEALSAATDMLTHEMSLRGFSYPGGYDYDIRVLPDVGGGTILNYPTVPVRLGAGGGNWSATHPAVGVYISFRVHTFMMSIVGRSTVEVHVFAAAEVTPPVECP
jgi:hypothetical protein